MPSVHHLAKPIKLPAWTVIVAIGPARVQYPVWIERRARRAYSIAGEVSFAVPLVILIGRRRALPVHRRLKDKLQRWGYRRVSLRRTKKD